MVRNVCRGKYTQFKNMGKAHVIGDGEAGAGSSGLSNGGDAAFPEGITILKDLRDFI